MCQATAPKATVKTLGMTSSPLSNTAFRRLNPAFGVKALQASWPSSASQQQAWRFWPSWPVQAPEHAMVSEATCAARAHAGAPDGTALGETAPVSTVMFLLEECLENCCPFSISLPQCKSASNDDAETQIIRELIIRQFHRGRELRRKFPLGDPSALPRSTWQASWWT